MCITKRESGWWKVTGALAAFLFMARAVFGAEPDDATRSFWSQQIDLLQILIGALFAAFVWFARRTLERIEKIVDKQSDLIVRIDGRLTKLEAEHAIMACKQGVKHG